MADRNKLGRSGDRRKQTKPAKAVLYSPPTPVGWLQEKRRGDFPQIFLEDQWTSEAETPGVPMTKLMDKIMLPETTQELSAVTGKEETKLIGGILSDRNIICDQFEYSETNPGKARDQLSPQDGNLDPADIVSFKQHPNGKQRPTAAHGVTDRTLDLEELPSNEKGIFGGISATVKDRNGGTHDNTNFLLQYSRSIEYSPLEHKQISSKSSKSNGFASNHSSNLRSDGGVGSVSEDYCEVCQKRFCNKYYMKKHRQDVHGRSEAANSLTGHAKTGPKCSEGRNNFNIGKFWGLENSSFDLQMFNSLTPDGGVFARLSPGGGSNHFSQLKCPERNQISDIASDFKKFGRLANLDEYLKPMTMVPKGGSPQFSGHSFGNGALLPEEKVESGFDRMLAGFVAAKGSDRVFCDLCGKAVCSKHFLKTHKARFHHGCVEKFPFSSAGLHRSPSFGPFSSSLSSLVGGISSTKSFAVEDRFATKPGVHLSTSERSNFDNFFRNVFRADDLDTLRSKDNYLYHLDTSIFANNCLSTRLEQDVRKIGETFGKHHNEINVKDPSIVTTTKVSCLICGKVLCNKYFLKIHMARKHRMEHDGEEEAEQNQGADKFLSRNEISNVDPASKKRQTGITDGVLGENDKNFADEVNYTCGLQCESIEPSKFYQCPDLSRIKDKSETVNLNRNGSHEISSDDKMIPRVSPSSSGDADSDNIKDENTRNVEKVLVPHQGRGISKPEHDVADKTEVSSRLISGQNSSTFSAGPELWQDETNRNRSGQRDVMIEPRFRCPYCRKRFKTSPKLVRHKKKSHNDINLSADGPTPENAPCFPESFFNADVIASRASHSRLLSPFLGRHHVTGELRRPDDTGSLPLRPFLIKDLAGNDRFCPAVVYLPSLRTLSSPTAVTFTLTPLAE